MCFVAVNIHGFFFTSVKRKTKIIVFARWINHIYGREGGGYETVTKSMNAYFLWNVLWWWWCCWLVPGTGISSETGFLIVADACCGSCCCDDIGGNDTGLPPDWCCCVCAINGWRFLNSVTDLKLADRPSLDASEIDNGDVWSKDPALSAPKVKQNEVFKIVKISICVKN